MQGQPEPIILILPDGALLSVVCARLAMAGETPVTACDCRDPKLDAGLRRHALLAVDARSVAADPLEAVRLLRETGWGGPLAMLVDGAPAGPAPDGVCWVGRAEGSAGLLAAFRLLRAG